jgi:hypothetical protein
LFDARDSMVGTLENPTLDLNPALPETLDVITATRAGTATFTDANGNIASAPANTVRVDHVDGVPMILVEPSATNLVTYSEDFGNSLYTKRNSTVTSGFSSPDGENNAFKLTATANEGDVYFVLGGGGGTTKAVSVFAKAASATSELIIQELGYTGRSTKFNLNSGAITFSNSAGTSTIENFGNGWFKCTHIETYSSGQNTLAYAYRSTTVDSLYLFGAQVETGSVSTSYIPTSGSTVTRAADDLAITGSDFTNFYNTTDGTFYLEAIDNDTTSGTHSFLRGQTEHRDFLFKYNGTSIHSFDGSTGVSQSGIAANQLFRAAVSYKSGARTLSLNGTSPADVSLNTNWTTADRLRIGNGNQVVANMHVRRVIFWPYHKDNL